MISSNATAIDTFARLMESRPDFSFQKCERLCSRTEIERLFQAGSRAFTSFPLKAVFRQTKKEGEMPPVSVLISVPKRRIRKAVHRNRIKRLIREAYRTNKHVLWNAVEAKEGVRVVLAFLWISDGLHSSHKVSRNIKGLLVRMAETLQKEVDGDKKQL